MIANRGALYNKILGVGHDEPQLVVKRHRAGDAAKDSQHLLETGLFATAARGSIGRAVRAAKDRGAEPTS